MPRYSYRCSECDETYEISHSIQHVVVDCKLCGAQKSLQRVYDIPLIIKNNKEENLNKRPGDILKKFIEEAKEDLQEQKEEAKRVKV